MAFNLFQKRTDRKGRRPNKRTVKRKNVPRRKPSRLHGSEHNYHMKLKKKKPKRERQ